MQDTTDKLRKQISSLPRIRLAHLPTPLELLPRLSAHLGGPRIWIKRDDCTGLATGGNKARKLEFLIADALQHHADSVITQGAVQSNHARQTAAAAAINGLKCHLLFERRVTTDDDNYANSGNVLLDRLMGASTTDFPAGTDMNAEMESLATKLRAQGEIPYVIPGGGSNSIGAVGYVNAALELLDQSKQIGVQFDHIVHATGSSGTQAGMVAGLHGAESKISLLGIGVRAPRERQEQQVYELACKTAARLGIASPPSREMVVANCDYVGDGYGLPTDGMLEAVSLLARLEGILLDPVYSGKGMAGLIDLIRNGRFPSTQDIVFIHTGGSAGLFGYRWAMPNLS